MAIHPPPLKQMLQRLSYPSTPSSLPRSRAHASYHYHTCRECLVIYSELCLVDVAIGFFWMVITAAFFPLHSITLRYDGCLLAKHKHLRFRLAKRRVILRKAQAPFYPIRNCGSFGVPAKSRLHLDIVTLL